MDRLTACDCSRRAAVFACPVLLLRSVAWRGRCIPRWAPPSRCRSSNASRRFPQCALACLAAMQASRNGIDLWLAAWATDPDSLPRHTWLRGLALLLFVSILLAFLRSLALSSAGLSAARSVHASLLGALLAAPAAFFDVADPRALLSRFSADVPVIDDLLPQHMGLLLAGGAELLGAAAVLFCKQPILLAGLPPLVVAFSFISRFFRFARREIRRLEDVLAPPLHALTLGEHRPFTIRAGGARLLLSVQRCSACVV